MIYIVKIIIIKKKKGFKEFIGINVYVIIVVSKLFSLSWKLIKSV